MATLLDQIVGAAGNGLATLIKTVMDEIKLSPEAKAEVEEKLAANQLALAQSQADLEAKLMQAASDNIRSEESGDDKYTKRARPTFLYICEAILGWNFIVMNIVHGFRPSVQPLPLPHELYWLFGSVMLGYTGARTWEKFMGMDGDSNVQISTPLGSLKAQNNSK